MRELGPGGCSLPAVRRLYEAMRDGDTGIAGDIAWPLYVQLAHRTRPRDNRSAEVERIRHILEDQTR